MTDIQNDVEHVEQQETPAPVETAPVAPVEKVTPTTRKALALAAFTESSTAPATDEQQLIIATLFAACPQPREHVDTCYNTVTGAISLATSPDEMAGIGALLAPVAVLRQQVLALLDTLVVAKTARAVDPAAERAALLARLTGWVAMSASFQLAAEYVDLLLMENDPGDLTSDESAALLTGTVPEKFATALANMAKLITSTPRAAGTGDGTRNTVAHVAPAIGTVLHGTGKYDQATCLVVPVVDGAGVTQPGVAYQVDGTTYDAISTAASAICGSQRNGWEFFAETE